MTPYNKKKSYLCPPKESSDKEKLVWAAQAYAQGLAFLETQDGWQDLDLMERVINGERDKLKQPTGLSEIEVNRIAREKEEMVSTYANIRPIAGYETDNAKYDDQCRILNKCSQAWYYSLRTDQHLEQALDNAAISTGYLSPYWEKDYYGPGEGEINLKILDTRQVVVFQMPPDNDLQRAYTVFIEEVWPIALAHETWDEYADEIQPDGSVTGNPTNILGKALDYVLGRPAFKNSPLKNRDANKRKAIGSYDTVTVRYIYINDRSTNETGKPVRMGKWSKEGAKANWSYEVPALGDPIPLGYKNPTGRYDEATGEEIYADATRPADKTDCLLYPQRRLMVIVGEVVVYDDASYWWHGEVPVIPFRLARRKGQFLGVSPFRTNVSLQQANNSLRRVVSDKAEVLCDPPLMCDDTIAETDFRKLNIRKKGQRFRVNMKTMAGETPIRPIVAESVLKIPAEVIDHIEKNDETMDYLVALEGSTAIFRATQQPAADTVDKMLDMIGPVPVSRSRMMEASVAQLFKQVGSLILQWYDRPRRMRLLGPSGMTKEDFEEFDPDSMIPTEFAGRPDLTNAHRVRRARHFQGMLRYRLVHKSLHELTQTVTKMIRLQMQRSGMMISEGTVAEAFEVENYIKYPPELVTEAEKWAYEQQFKAETLAKIQQSIAPAQQGGVDPNMMAVLQKLAEQYQSNGGLSGPGRKPTGQEAPRAQMSSDNNGGQRMRISESG